MTFRITSNLRAVVSVAFAILILPCAFALDGQLRCHDPSTVAVSNGHYYVFSTGPGIPILESDDGYNWKREGKVFDKIPESVRSLSPKNNGTLVWAPDVIQMNGEYYLYYSVSSWGSFVSVVGLMTNPTLDRSDPRYAWTDRGPIVNSAEGEDLNAIDPGVLKGPDGRVWICYGSYHGTIQMVELDAKTGLRISKNSPVSVLASHSEASDLIYHDGYYYLFVNHGSCCQGKNSGYNIRVGRSKEVTGPYLDKNGDDLAHGAGSLFLAAAGTQIGPGHFGLLLDDGLERFSCHYEADLEKDKDGKSSLDIRPLLWSPDGWPAPGANAKSGTYQIVCERTGSVMEVSAKPAENSEVSIGTYVTLDNQKWSIEEAGGGYYRMNLASGGKTLEWADVPEHGTMLRVAPRSDAENQLWKLDQLTNGSFRIMTKSSKQAVTAITAGGGANAVRLSSFTGDKTQRWQIAAP